MPRTPLSPLERVIAHITYAPHYGHAEVELMILRADQARTTIDVDAVVVDSKPLAPVEKGWDGEPVKAN